MTRDFVPPAGSLVIESTDFYPGCSNHSTETRTLPDNWRSDSRSELDCGAYEFEFDMLDTQEVTGVLVPSYRFHITFRVNEIEFARSKGRRNSIIPFYIEIPAEILEKGMNKVRIELRSEPLGQGFLDKIVIGDPTKLQAIEHRLSLVRFMLLQIISVIILIFSGISIFLYLVERDAVEFLYFSLLSIAWVVHIFNFIWSDPIFPIYIWMKMVLCAVLTFATFGTLFVSVFLDAKFARIDKIIKFMALIWYPVLILLPFDKFMLVGQFILMPYVLAIGFLTAYKFIVKLQSTSLFEVGDMFLALSIAILVTGINDVALMMNIIDSSVIFYLNYSAAMLILGIWFHIFSKYFRLLKLEKNFSNVLESELSTQKQNLRASLKRERDAIEKNAALNERDNVMRDLHDSLGSRLISLIRLSSGEQKTQVLAQETLDELRFMTTPLRVEDRDIVTLLATFREQRLSRLEQAGYTVNWSVEFISDPPQWNTQQAMEFLRILDELLGNALKHGTDDGITISLSKDPKLKLSFVNRVAAGNPHNSESAGAGLTNIHMRAQKIAANFRYTADKDRYVAEIHW